MAGRRLDYLVIGHVTHDRIPGGVRVGGTATYAARTAQVQGCHTAVLTSLEEGVDLTDTLPEIDICRVPAQVTTTFDNQYTPVGRVQTLQAIAAPLTPDQVPSSWKNASIVHLGPVAGECDPALAQLFPDAFLGLTPQGWMRSWDEAGRVGPALWQSADVLLPRADAVVLSEEDVGGDAALISRWAGRTRLLAVTRGEKGCTIYVEGTACNVPVVSVEEGDPTGAGDIFAAVFFVRVWEGEDPRAAARLANCVAAASVTRLGLSAIPTTEEIIRCQARCV